MEITLNFNLHMASPTGRAEDISFSDAEYDAFFHEIGSRMAMSFKSKAF